MLITSAIPFRNNSPARICPRAGKCRCERKGRPGGSSNPVGMESLDPWESADQLPDPVLSTGLKVISSFGTLVPISL